MSTTITTSQLRDSPAAYAPVASSTAYWNDRADRFASRGSGLGAVCSYGMPGFYNGSIHLLQRLALNRWLRVRPGTKVLEIGCGVGRWSCRLARRGAIVTGIDLSHKMIARARERAVRDGLGDHCRFVVADVCAMPLQGTFDLVLGVTVLQHILDPVRFQLAVATLAGHLRPGGRMILLEAAPSRLSTRCDSPVFVARQADVHFEAFRRAGLECVAVSGVDPAPLKTWFLPRYRTLPKAVALGGLAAITAAGLVPDLVLGRVCAAASWHKVFVLVPRPAPGCDEARG